MSAAAHGSCRDHTAAASRNSFISWERYPRRSSILSFACALRVKLSSLSAIKARWGHQRAFHQAGMPSCLPGNLKAGVKIRKEAAEKLHCTLERPNTP